jgi:hypothetical protein
MPCDKSILGKRFSGKFATVRWQASALGRFIKEVLALKVRIVTLAEVIDFE